MQDLLNKAIEMAKIAHKGQVDKGDSPYIEHPFRVMNQMDTEEEKIVGVLHDAVEDSNLTLEDLSLVGFSDLIIEAVDAITKREGEDIQHYLSRVMDNPIALKVKIADMTDNMDLTRIPNITEKDRERLRNYQKNIIQLQNKLSEMKNQLKRAGNTNN